MINFKLTPAGEKEIQNYLKEMKAFRKEIMDGKKDTCDETSIDYSVQDIFADLLDLGIDIDGEIYNGYGVTDNYDMPYPICLRLGRDFIADKTIEDYETVPYGSVEVDRTNGLLGLQLNKYNVVRYDYHDIDAFISLLTEEGYECTQVDEGSLGNGDWICIAPDESHSYIIRERFVSSWQSTHTIEKTDGIPKEISAELRAHAEKEEKHAV